MTKRGTYKDGNVLEAVPGTAALVQRLFVLENKGNLNDTGDTDGHERLAKHGVCHGADHELLGVSRHGPAGDEDDKGGDKIALGVAVAITAHPDTSQAGAPPDNTHGRVLPVVPDPGGAPAMLSKGVDAAPDGNDGGIKEFLRTTGAAHPNLAPKEDNGQDNAVCDKCAAHNEVCSALAKVVALAEAESGNAAENHLNPGQQRHGLANDGVKGSDQQADSAVDAALPVALEVETEDNLADEEQLEDVGKEGVDIRADILATAVHVSEEEAEEGQTGADDLGRYVPSRLGHLQRRRLGVRCDRDREAPSGRDQLTPRTMPMGKMTP